MRFQLSSMLLRFVNFDEWEMACFSKYPNICDYLKKHSFSRKAVFSLFHLVPPSSASKAILTIFKRDLDANRSLLGHRRLKITVAERRLDSQKSGTRNKRGESSSSRGCSRSLFVGTRPKFRQVRRGFSPLLFGVATPRGIVRVRRHQRVQQHGMTTGSLIVPSRRLHAALTGLPRLQVIARECADILATMDTRVRWYEVTRSESWCSDTQDRSAKTMLGEIARKYHFPPPDLRWHTWADERTYAVTFRLLSIKRYVQIISRMYDTLS